MTEGPIVICYTDAVRHQLDALTPTGDAAIVARAAREPAVPWPELPLWWFTDRPEGHDDRHDP